MLTFFMGHFPRLGTYVDSIFCTGCSQAAPLHPLESEITHQNHLSPVLSIATGSARAVSKKRSKKFPLSGGHGFTTLSPLNVSIMSSFLILATVMYLGRRLAPH